jgi:hypothetical protein
VEAAIANYQSSRLPFIAVLEALQTLFGDRASLARLTADHARLVANLEEASLESTTDMAGASSGSALSLASPGSADAGGGMSGR